MYLVLIGTKAQLIKVAPVMLEFARRRIKYHLVLTGQHEDTMIDIIGGFGLRPPDDVLIKPREADTKRKLVFWLLQLFPFVVGRRPIVDCNPNYDACLVHGDTLSTLIGALVARRRGVPVVHLEAGLRSYSLLNPFPEEIVRMLVARLARFHFCPDRVSAENLSYLPKGRVKIVGNSHEDSVQIASSGRSWVGGGGYYVVSFHRVENLESKVRMRKILRIVKRLSCKTPIKLVLHPTTKIALSQWRDSLEGSDIELIDRKGFFEFIDIILASDGVLTDGGSNQEECAYLGVPCVLLRSHTERQDGLGKNVLLSNYNERAIVEFFEGSQAPFCRDSSMQRQSPSEEIVDQLQLLLVNGAHQP